MASRPHIGLRIKLAAALLELGHVSYSDAKLMSADQLISLYEFDHGILVANGGSDDFWNLTPRLIADHREKTKRDIAIVAKVKRIRNPSTKPKRKWSSRKIPPRINPWPKRIAPGSSG